MGRLIPKISIEKIHVKPERDVARALTDKLPEDCIVYHSYPWLKLDRSDLDRKHNLKEGETDFVVIDPLYGILILEVKGGQVEFDPTYHKWYRILNDDNKKEIKDPFAQARASMHYLKDQIWKNSFPDEQYLPCAFGSAVVFPDCEYAGPMPPGADEAIVLSASDLPYIDRRLRDVLKKWSRLSKPKRLSKGQLDGVLKGLSPSFQLLPVLFRQLEEQEEKLFRMTEEQVRILDFLNNRPRAAINGVAGSGKTLIARAQAERFAEAGKDTLMVCYNRSLAEWLRSSIIDEYQDKITVRNFHGLCHDFCKEAGIEFFPNADSEDFWRYKASDKFMEAIEAVPRRFDAIVVDEGQDFYSDWWVPLQLLNRESDKGPFYVFYDPAQNLFVEDDLSTPDLGTPFNLPTNCRNTKKIASFCSEVRGIDINVREDAPEGIKCEVHVAKTLEEQVRLCMKFLYSWMGQGKLKPSQIAILGPHAKSHSSLAKVGEIHKVKITSKLENWEKGQGILYSSIRSFKGLEADAVIMIDIPEPDSIPHFGRSDFYVGCSRAKHLLVVLANSPSAI